MKNNNNLKKIYVSLALLIILGISFVSSFSVSYPYMENKTLTLPLNSKPTDLQFVLQNGGGATENVSIKVQLLEGSGIASIIDENNIYTVVPGSKVPVNLRITLPDSITVGNTYNIRLEFTAVSVGQSGQFGFGTGQEQSFKVVIGNEVIPEKTKPIRIILYIILGILVLLVIMVLVLIKRKKKK